MKTSAPMMNAAPASGRRAASPLRVEGDGPPDLPLREPDRAKQNDFRQSVIERAEPGAGYARGTADDQPQEKKAEIIDGREGQHPLELGLGKGEQRTAEHR